MCGPRYRRRIREISRQEVRGGATFFLKRMRSVEMRLGSCAACLLTFTRFRSGKLTPRMKT